MISEPATNHSFYITFSSIIYKNIPNLFKNVIKWQYNYLGGLRKDEICWDLVNRFNMVLVDSFCNVSDQQHVGMGCALFRNRISCLQHWSKDRGKSWNNCRRNDCHNGIAIKKRRKNVFLLNCIKCRTKAAESRLLLSGIFRFWYIFCQMRHLINQRAKLSGQFFAKLFRDSSVTEGNRPAYAKKPDQICRL